MVGSEAYSDPGFKSAMTRQDRPSTS